MGVESKPNLIFLCRPSLLPQIKQKVWGGFGAQLCFSKWFFARIKARRWKLGYPNSREWLDQALCSFLGFLSRPVRGLTAPRLQNQCLEQVEICGAPPQSWILFLKGISWLICAAKTPRCQLSGSAKGVQIPVEQHRAGCPPIATGKHPPASLTLFLGSFLAFLQGFFQGPILLGTTARPSHVPLWKEGEKGK